MKKGGHRSLEKGNVRRRRIVTADGGGGRVLLFNERKAKESSGKRQLVEVN